MINDGWCVESPNLERKSIHVRVDISIDRIPESSFKKQTFFLEEVDQLIKGIWKGSSMRNVQQKLFNMEINLYLKKRMNITHRSIATYIQYVKETKCKGTLLPDHQKSYKQRVH